MPDHDTRSDLDAIDRLIKHAACDMVDLARVDRGSGNVDELLRLAPDLVAEVRRLRATVDALSAALDVWTHEFVPISVVVNGHMANRVCNVVLPGERRSCRQAETHPIHATAARVVAEAGQQ